MALTQYGHSAWRSTDGGFAGSPTAITQTSDGYVWLGTSAGVFRFDGVRFDALAAPSGEAGLAPSILQLQQGSDGSLWIGTGRDVERWKDGNLTHFDLKGRIHGLVEDSRGDHWATRVGTRDGKGPLCRISGSTSECFGVADGIPMKYALALLRARDGGLWFGSSTTLERWTTQSSETHRVVAEGLSDDLNGIEALSEAPGGGILVGFTAAGRGAGLQRFADGHWQPFNAQGLAGESLRVSTLLVDRAGAIWIGTSNDGLYRVTGNRAEHLRSNDGLSSDTVVALLEDREGNLWVATSKGLDRFRGLRVAGLSSREGLSEDAAQSVAASADGSVWIGNTHAIDRVQGDGVTSVRAGAGNDVHEFTDVSVDRSGRLWAGVDNGLAVLENGRLKRIDSPDGQPLGVVVDMAHGLDGDTWVLALPQRLWHIVDGRVVSEIGARTPRLSRLLADPSGSLWASTENGDLARYHDGTFEIAYHPSRAAPSFRGLANGPDGEVVATGAQGLVVWRNGTARRMSVANGLPCDRLYAPVFDRQRSLWLSSNCGILKIAAEDLAHWWTDPGHRVNATVLDSSDGAQADSTFFGTSAARSQDGRLWFVNGVQAEVIDPDRPGMNHIAPPVHLQALIADRRRYEPGSHETPLPPAVRDLQIDYTATSFVAPQKVRFRYRLEGHDSSWQDVGTRRSAFYTDLAPGHYRFRVIACNDDGVWNETGASVDFAIPPTFVQTRWFLVLCAGAVLALAWLALHLRVRHASERIRIGLEERTRERERIAASCTTPCCRVCKDWSSPCTVRCG